MTRHIRPTLLIVDDMVSNIEILSQLLENLYRIKIAKTGSKAIEIANGEERPDLILLDIVMPDMDGYTVCETLKASPKTEPIPIIFITSKSNPEDEAHGLNIGAADYIAKPFIPSIVLARVAHQIALLTNRALLSQYKDVVDRSSIVSKTDPRGVITYVNAQFCEISGYTEEELIGKPHKTVRHPDMPSELFAQMWHQIKVEKKPWNGVVKNRKKDGSSYWVKTTISPILSPAGEVIEYIGMRVDITDQEMMKEYFKHEFSITQEKFSAALRLSREYENAINQSNILSRADINGRITYVNDMFENISGFTKKEVIGKNHNIVRHPDTPDVVFQELWQTISSGVAWKGILKNRAKDGTAYWVDTVIVPIKDEHETIIEFMAIRHNLTQLFALHKEIESTQREIVYKMGEIGESRSKETGNHVKRVAEYSKLLAQLIGLDEAQCNTLLIASPMHDIGKVGIPDSVLKKPGKLDAQEWEVMKTHATIGYEILKGSNREILKAAAFIAKEHHEKWDGSGYPANLKGEEIHIFGRITAVADVFDALGSARCYKEAWPLENILALFEAEKGRHFDPQLVEIFFENLPLFLRIRDNYVD